MAEDPSGQEVLSDEDRQRAKLYILLARLIYDPPDSELLQVVRDFQGDGSRIGSALAALGETARRLTPEAINDEYQALFVRIDQDELKPYASHALTGRFYSKPLVQLREDMERLGITRDEGLREPEDHITPLCEMMAGLILGQFVAGSAPLSEQQRFFARYLESWAPDFFRALSDAEAADFYRDVGRLGAAFLDVEHRSFEMVA